ncbi:MAG: hypothetical protein ACTSYI_13005 [Promethearchaeota archaeon]
MPSSNPKHAKKKVTYTRQKTLKQSGVPARYWIMGAIGILVITAVILVVINIDSLTNPDDDPDPTLLNTIIDGCWISFNYKVFADLDDDGEIDYLGDDAEVHAFIDYHTTQVTVDNFIPGWYDGLIGMGKDGVNSDKYIDIEAFIDENNDGRNDLSGNLPMGYTGNDPIAYEALVIHVIILEIYAESTFDMNTVTYTQDFDPIQPQNTVASSIQVLLPKSLLPSQITSALLYGESIF